MPLGSGCGKLWGGLFKGGAEVWACWSACLMGRQRSGFDQDTNHKDLHLGTLECVRRLLQWSLWWTLRENIARSLSSLIPDWRGLVFSIAVIFRSQWAWEWRLAPWQGSLGRAPGDPLTTTDSWASPDCSVSEAGPAAAPGRQSAGVIHTITTTMKKVNHAAIFFPFTQQETQANPR